MTASHYHIVARIEAGACCEIWLAQQDLAQGGLDREVVVKTLLPHRAESAALVAQFVDGAALGSRLDHPNIARVLDYGELAGRHFVAVEHVAGPTLRRLLDRLAAAGRRLPFGAALRTLVSACHGLQHAHERGVVHGDLCPEHVVISLDGEVKLIDFGGGASVVTERWRYLAPERLQGEPAGPRGDLY